MNDKDWSGTGMVDDFRKACPRARSLNVADTSDVWVSKFGRHLETLEVASGNPFHGFPKGCSFLGELNPAYAYGSEEREDFFLFDMDDIAWRNVGDSLESFTLSHFIPYKRGYNGIRKHCRKLRRIVLDEPQLEDKNTVKFIASYAYQLEFAHVYRIGRRESDQLMSL